MICPTCNEERRGYGGAWCGCNRTSNEERLAPVDPSPGVLLAPPGPEATDEELARWEDYQRDEERADRQYDVEAWFPCDGAA